MNETSTGASSAPCTSTESCCAPGTATEHDKEFIPHPILDHHHAEHHNNHVHFDSNALNEDPEEESGGIRYILTDPKKNIVTIHLGFMQIQHRYNLDIHLPLDLCAATQQLASSEAPVAIKLEQCEPAKGTLNLWCKLLEYNNELDAKSSPAVDFVVEFMAYKEKFLREEMRLRLNDADEMTIVFTARVLGKGMGTPLLRTGVQSVSVEVDDADGTSSDATGVLN